MVNIISRDFELLKEYKADNQKRAERVASYQQKIADANGKLNELQAEYEKTFTDAAKAGKDATDELDKIHEQIVQAKFNLERAEKEHRMANAALEHSSIDTVEIVDKFNNEFTPSVNAEISARINPKIELAKRLILSAIDDYRAHENLYNDVRSDVVAIANLNKELGKTREIMGVASPVKAAKIYGENGIRNAVTKMLHEIQNHHNGYKSIKYDYVENVEDILTKKGGK